jgi:ubiquinone/menaquinone biosynthesis C-methylase UbiE
MTTDAARTSDPLREAVRQKYAQRARAVTEGTEGSCCGDAASDPITMDLYTADEETLVPEDALKASLGCGNPTALAELREGETVLDLGSGGGIDVLLSARRVGPTGFAYGLDMTDEMLELARKNAAEQGATNVEFLEGQIEHVPLPDSSVDVVISNCVINLSTDKDRVLREAFRVLRPNGRFAVSDVVAQGDLPADLRKDLAAWVGCVAGALEENEYRAKLEAAGFVRVDVEVTRVYNFRDEAYSTRPDWKSSAVAAYEASGGRLVSAFVRARKPD